MKILIDLFENLMVSIAFAEEGVQLDLPYNNDQEHLLQHSVNHTA